LRLIGIFILPALLLTVAQSSVGITQICSFHCLPYGDCFCYPTHFSIVVTVTYSAITYAASDYAFAELLWASLGYPRLWLSQRILGAGVKNRD